MKKLIFTGFLYLILGNSYSVMCQSPVLSFDGLDDYVDLGIEAGNGVRTIELWFRPTEEINTNLDNLTPLVMRYTGIYNIDEFSLSFQPSNLPNPGSLRFDITEILGENRSVYTDANLWEKGKWYHVAAVVHPSLGMMIFVDGIKQSSTNDYYSSPASNDYITSLASWGSRFDLDRYFSGRIEDVRFSSEAIYIEDFVPDCPDISVLPSTIAVWNFNENTGNTVIDSSSHNYDGQVVGAAFESSLICDISSNISEIDLINLIEVFPNPSSNYITVSLNNEFTGNIILYNSLGQAVLSKPINGKSERIDISKLKTGIYFYQIKKGVKIIGSGKIIKNKQRC